MEIFFKIVSLNGSSNLFCLKKLWVRSIPIPVIIFSDFLLFVKSSKFLGKYLWKKIDGLVIDRFGPDGLSSLFKYFSIKAVKFQSGFIYQYAFVMLIGFPGFEDL